MPSRDRRQNQDRRKTPRHTVTIDVEWESHNGRRSGSLSDVSAEGCFILSDVEVSDGELVKVFLPLTDGTKVEFMGQVANYVSEIGFAVHFLSISEAQKEFLANFIEVHTDQKKD